MREMVNFTVAGELLGTFNKKTDALAYRPEHMEALNTIDDNI